MSKDLLIFGAGEFATLTRFYFEYDGGRKVAAFVVDDEYARDDGLDGLPVVAYSEALRRFPPSECDVNVAIAYAGLNTVRQQKFETLRAAGYAMASYVSPKATVFPDLVLGENCLILEQASVQPTARIGQNVIVGPGSLVGHATFVQDHGYIASGVILGGNCEIGERCFLGLGAMVKDHCKIGSDSFVTMGACVTRDLPQKSVILAAKSEAADPVAAEYIREQYFPTP